MTTPERDTGFSLIELLITVAIIGIIAAIAYPSYGQYMQKNRRTEAIAFLAHAAGEQQRFFSDNTRYASSLKELGFGEAATATTAEGYYTISVSNVDPAGAAGGTSEVHFELKATPVAGGLQAGDAACGVLSINERGVKGMSGTGTVQDCW